MGEGTAFENCIEAIIWRRKKKKKKEEEEEEEKTLSYSVFCLHKKKYEHKTLRLYHSSPPNDESLDQIWNFGF